MPLPTDEMQSDPEPVVSITAMSSSITEGADARFTLTAIPAPSAALTVNVNVATVGDFGVTRGTQTATIPVTGTIVLGLGTTDDSVDESNGSITVTLNTGNGYTPSTTSRTATIAVNDNDDPPQPQPTQTATATPQPTQPSTPSNGNEPVVSVVPLSSTGNTGDVEFTASLSPAPTQPDIFYFDWTADGCKHKTGNEDQLTEVSGQQESVTIETTGSGLIGFSGFISEDGSCSVTVTLHPRSGYTIDPPRNTATIDVSQTPVVSISASQNNITAGSTAVFTLTANPAPTAPLTVYVDIDGDREFGITPYGSRTVEIPVSGTYDLSITTTDDSKDDDDGSITVKVEDNGNGYTRSPDNHMATISVAANDNPE